MRVSFVGALLVLGTNAFMKPYTFQSKIGLNGKRNKNQKIDIDIDPYDTLDYEPPEIKNKYTYKTSNQKNYLEAVENNDIPLVICQGPAGTGKTLFATQYAAKLLKDPSNDKKVIITRPLVTVGEELGYLPGGISQKMNPWTIPIFDILREFFERDQLSSFVREGLLEIVPLAFMRGRTFKDSFIIADEMQNSSPEQFKMLVTRVGDGSKIVVTGDPEQTDTMEENGLRDFMSRISITKESDMIKHVTLGSEDIQRSPLVAEIIEIYNDDRCNGEDCFIDY